MRIIPGSMTAPGFLVRGKGAADALNSASHGIGHLMSGTKTLNSITNDALKKVMAEKDVLLIRGDLDEAPMAYKNIEMVIASQTELVDVLARFSPKIIRMADADRKEGRED